MEITREQLEKRLAGLQKGREETLTELHATSGAIQECEYWLNELTKEVEEKVDGSNKSS